MSVDKNVDEECDMKISAIARLKELRALQEAWKSEISACLSAMANPARVEAELARETEKLKRQQEIVDRMIARRDNAEEFLHNAQTSLRETTEQVAFWANKAQIERLLMLQVMLDQAKGLAPAPVVAAQDPEDEDEDEDDLEDEDEDEDDE